MRIAFLGNQRFIGRVAAERAVSDGHSVTIIHSGRYPTPVEGAEYVIATRQEPEALKEVIKRARPDSVIHTASMTRVDATKAVEALRSVVPRVVVLSSQDVYAQFGALLGHTLDAIEDVVTEDSPTTVPYPFRGIHEHSAGPDYDKKDVEAVYADSVDGFDVVAMLRLPATYGRHDKTRRFGWAVDPLDAGESEIPHQGGGWRWTHAHVYDVADAILLAADKAGPGHHIFNVGEERTPSMRQRVEGIARRMGQKFAWTETKKLPERFSFLGAMANDFVVSTERIRSELGYIERTTTEQREKDLIDWLRSSRQR